MGGVLKSSGKYLNSHSYSGREQIHNRYNRSSMCHVVGSNSMNLPSLSQSNAGKKVKLDKGK